MNIDVPITGTNYRQDTYDHWCRYGVCRFDLLELERDWDNKDDPHAVKVMYRYTSSTAAQQMGWIAKGYSDQIAKKMLTHKVVPIAVVKNNAFDDPMRRLTVRFNCDGELEQSVQPPALPLMVIKKIEPSSDNSGAIQVIKQSPVGSVFMCRSDDKRVSVSLHKSAGSGDLAWFRKHDPGCHELVGEVLKWANRGALVARIETQNPLTMSLHRKGDIKEPEYLTGSAKAKAVIAAALVEARQQSVAGTITQPTSTTQKESTMNNLNLNAFFSRLFAVNTKAAADAAYLETGRIANKTVAKIVIGRLPWLARFYARTPLGSLAIANSAIVLAQQLRPNDERLSKLATAMATNAYQELIQTLDVEGMVDQLLAEPAIKRALEKVDAKADGSTFEGRPGAQ